MSETAVKCVVVTPLGPEAEAVFERCQASVRDAAAHGLGGFAAVDHLGIDDPKGLLGDFETRNRGVAEALDRGADWIFHLDAGDILLPNAFELVAPVLASYDAVWGAQCLLDGDDNARLIRESLPAFQTVPRLLQHLAGRRLGGAHFVSAPAAADFPFRAAGDGAWIDYLLRLWPARPGLKTAQAYVALGAEPAPPGAGELADLDDFIAANEVFIDVPHGAEVFKLPYTGLNAVIENTQMGGAFFEQEALDYVAGKIPAGAVIIDIGANTGNHALYFAHVMKAARVLALEPNPDAIKVLRRAVLANGSKNIDLSLAGLGVGAAAGRYAVQRGEGESLGAAGLTPDPAGAVEVLPLDDIVARARMDRVDLIKIDVEEMEIAVLAGARGTISRHRPLIYIEVMDVNIADFLRFLADAEYRVARVFPEFTFANYVVAPL